MSLAQCSACYFTTLELTNVSYDTVLLTLSLQVIITHVIEITRFKARISVVALSVFCLTCRQEV